ncbi:conserved hypothetical protein [Paecilomyces variotii No. 5]|uniref:Ima1 N-terminal domain-containing protein n=1 Tax=Byssochlamys spectabilis (strain No. 5 / NBRC 109023) TaxID=1356009 RepID=V5FX89_BYSSN|nr:conserved hypothetical protein [Paecilomyces variotii No. 5]
MAAIFQKRLRCFYCGRRSAQADKGPIRRWHCKHCEAVNYLDENGEITDPPAAETNPEVYGPGASSPPFESINFGESGLFCSKCARNQHLFTSALASYFPATDDPAYAAYEREYPKFRQNLEERYPQVCQNCEPRIKERIRQAGYEAKSDHLRRMMERSKTGRAARKARNRNWRSVLVFAGALGYWASVAGQLAWSFMGSLSAKSMPSDSGDALNLSSFTTCVTQSVLTRRVDGYCSSGLAHYAGLALLLGILSLWWNPKLRFKVEGRTGRFIGLGEYYKVQLIVLVLRSAFWAVLKDPSTSGLRADLPPALHAFMMVFTILSVVVSRRVVRYDTRPLVLWSDNTPSATPNRKPETSAVPSTGNVKSTPLGGLKTEQPQLRFPFEKLVSASPAQRNEPTIPPTPPPEAEDMDWTPSLREEIKPTFSVYQKEKKSVLDGPLPFTGTLPPAPKPPSWQLRNPAPQKPVERIVQTNPFHHAPTQGTEWRPSRDRSSSDVVFAPPKFFPASDRGVTGLESLFDRTFTIKSPEEEMNEDWHRLSNMTRTATSNAEAPMLFPYLRLGLLLLSLLAWFLSETEHMSLPGDYIEVASLGSASLIAGFALLEILKRPIVQWNGMEILVSTAELVAAVHLGANLPSMSFERAYFDRYGKSLLVFMIAQEVLGLLSPHQSIQTQSQSASTASSTPQIQSGNFSTSFSGEMPHAFSRNDSRPLSNQSLSNQSFINQSFSNLSSAPSLSFNAPTLTSSLSSQPSVPSQQPYQPYSLGYNGGSSFLSSGVNDHGNDSDVTDPLEPDSDTETIATTVTNASHHTAIRNLRFLRDDDEESLPSPRRALGKGIGGLSLDDNPNPSRRATRSQTKRAQGQTSGYRRYPQRGSK